MNLKPSQNIQLYGMNNFFNEITNLYDTDKMPTKYYYLGKRV